LEEEGIKFKDNGKIDLSKYLWQPKMPLHKSQELIEEF
jgi:hypothetical protein